MLVYRASWMVGIAVIALCALWSWRAQAEPGIAGDAERPRVPSGQLLQRVGRMTLRVTDPDAAYPGIESHITSLGGRLELRRGDQLVFRLPADRLFQAMDDMAAFGFEIQRSVEVQDRTSEYLETTALLRSAQTTRDRIARLQHGAEGVEDPLRVQPVLTRWDARVAELQRALRDIRRSTSDAKLEIRTEPTTIPEPVEIPRFQLPFSWLDKVGLDRLMRLEHRGYVDVDDDEGLTSSTLINFHLQTMRASDEVLLGGNESALSLGLKMRGVGETTPIGFAAGTDIELGGGFSGGFLYEYRMVGGFGTSIGEVLSLGLVSGIGLSGLTGGYIPFGLDVPVEAFADLEIGEWVRFGGWGRTSWILASDERQDGSDAAPFGDESATGLSLLIGEDSGQNNRERVGLGLRGTYRELLGTHAYEVSVGIGMSFVEVDGGY